MDKIPSILQKKIKKMPVYRYETGKERRPVYLTAEEIEIYQNDDVSFQDCSSDEVEVQDENKKISLIDVKARQMESINQADINPKDRRLSLAKQKREIPRKVLATKIRDEVVQDRYRLESLLSSTKFSSFVHNNPALLDEDQFKNLLFLRNGSVIDIESVRCVEEFRSIRVLVLNDLSLYWVYQKPEFFQPFTTSLSTDAHDVVNFKFNRPVSFRQVFLTFKKFHLRALHPLEVREDVSLVFKGFLRAKIQKTTEMEKNEVCLEQPNFTDPKKLDSPKQLPQMQMGGISNMIQGKFDDHETYDIFNPKKVYSGREKKKLLRGAYLMMKGETDVHKESMIMFFGPEAYQIARKLLGDEGILPREN